MSDFLMEVAVRTRHRVEVQKRQVPVSQLRKRAAEKGPWRPFAKALRKPGQVAVIAELKQASPSAGMIRNETDIPGRIAGYTRGGASALSILTEE
jgi:indole-3-glycerol phosphate synthase